MGEHVCRNSTTTHSQSLHPTPSKEQSVDDIQAAPPLKNEISTLQKARASRSPQDWTTYCQYRNFCTSEFRAAKSAYLHRKHEEIASATDGSHRWWTLAKQLATISTPHLAIPDLRAGEDVVTTDFEKATLLAKYFASQCTSTAPPEHLKGAPFPLTEKQPIFDFLPIPELTVLRTLQHLPISKATAHPSSPTEFSESVHQSSAPLLRTCLTYLSLPACSPTPGNVLRSRQSSKIGALPVTPQTTARFRFSLQWGKCLTASKVLVYCNT